MVDFICPICGSQEFFSFRVPMESLKDIKPWLFVCGGCSVVFQDLEKFSCIEEESGYLIREQSQL